MNIAYIEIQNFRKLKSVRVDLSKATTVFVGANNSGKTSAMVALNYFLIDQRYFTINDFTLSNWSKINGIGDRWYQQGILRDAENLDLAEWESILPSIDIWLHVKKNEIHYVCHLLPTLDWDGEPLGVRLRFEPEDIKKFYKEYIAARAAAITTIESAKTAKNSLASIEQTNDIGEYTISLWPASMTEFLDKKLKKFFIVRAYILDPSQYRSPKDGIAYPQTLSSLNEPLEGNPFKGLIRIDKIDAHRGFSNLSSKSYDEEGTYDNKGRLSEQLRSYYDKHIDPTKMPEASDIDALEAIYQAQKQFDEKLKSGFKSKFGELENLGYPGITDPKLNISTKIRPQDSFNHSSALRYEVISHGSEASINPPCLPEYYNGLGYQNLISMVFRLMSFRDGWMRDGKARSEVSSETDDSIFIPPLHLVLVEEPEAHLHAQVQQVFIRKAYQVLRNHHALEGDINFTTQLVVSTHSSQVAHECEFSSLRYFRRKPAMNIGDVPVSTVVNLTEVFGENEKTKQFVTRYIKATHCDLFFADAAILVEGPAERMLVPHFIREHYDELNKSYITLLEIGGSHAHRLRPLIEHLGLITLIITDLDSTEPENNNSSKQPVRGQELITRNKTLEEWWPRKKSIDDLFAISDSGKVKEYDDPTFTVRVAYQCPVNIQFSKNEPAVEALSNTFEDAFVFENITIFKDMGGTGLIKKFRTAISEHNDPADLGQKMFKALQTGNKAEFALNILCSHEPSIFKVPTYIDEGLTWLLNKIKKKQKENLIQDIGITGQNK